MAVTRYLTVQQILFLHMRLIEETGGAYGVRDLGLLQAAATRPEGTWQGHDLYPGLFDKAGALMHSLIASHPMVDGNKRLGIAAAAIFLELNGYRLVATDSEVEVFTLRVAEGEEDASDVAGWLGAHAESKGRNV